MDNALPFELTEEAFTDSVVAAMPDGTHAAGQRVATQEALVVRTGELGALIGMKQYLLRLAPLLVGHAMPTTLRPDVGDVAAPDLVRSFGGELAVQPGSGYLAAQP